MKAQKFGYTNLCGRQVKKSGKIIKTLAALDETDEEIILISRKLPAARQFIISGKNEEEALLHIARAKCRTAETMAVEINCRPAADFLNKLSKYLFLAARHAAHSR
ncbi:MAG: ATP:cob(I)alamin adenosyltransferase [Elusimicrobia bacterium]|nr:ATP:cob(I)alamin adenosyltransferase [Elusimicrobiota bacterium]